MKLPKNQNQWIIYAVYGIAGIIIIAVILYLRNIFITLPGVPLVPIVSKSEVSPEVSPRPFKIRGSLPYWDQNRAYESFESNMSIFTSVSLFWYYVDEQGSVRKYTDAYFDPKILANAKKNGVRTSAVITNLPEVTGSTWDSNRVERILNNTPVRESHIKEIRDLLRETGFDGVTIDFEEVNQSEEDSFTLYIAELVEVLRPDKKFVGVALHPKIGERSDRQYRFQNWERLAAVADELYIMAYGEHWDEGSPGPIASTGWVEKIVTYLKQQDAPFEKFYLGVSLYGYDWKIESEDKATGLTYRDVKLIMERYGIANEWGEDTPAPFFRYKDEEDQQHEVWFENGPSVEEKVRLARNGGLGGVTFWRLGNEDPEVWERVRGMNINVSPSLIPSTVSTSSAHSSQPSTH